MQYLTSSIFTLISVMVFILGGPATNLHAESPREQLTALVTQLQGNPSDQALREQIIKLAQEIDPAPAIPEEARQHFVEGTTIAKSAQNSEQQELAVQSFEDALKIAPWWGDAYYNLAVAQELAGQLDAAQSSLKLYILTNPGDQEAREAQDRIYALNAKKKLAVAEQNSPDAIAEREMKFLDELEGAVWLTGIISTPMDPELNGGRNVLYGRAGYIFRKHQLHRMSGVGWWPGENEPALDQGGVSQSFSLESKRINVDLNPVRDPSCNPATLQISDDGKLLTETTYCYGQVSTFDYTRAPQ